MKSIKTILLIVACATIIFLSFYLLNNMLEIKHEQARVFELNAKMQMKNEFYYLNFDINNQMTGKNAPNIFCFENRNKENYLSELVQEKSLLIYRYTHKDCNTCYESEIQSLQEVFKDSIELTSILCSYYAIKDYLAFKKMVKVKTHIYHISFGAFDWIAEDCNKPYYFVLHPDMKISHVYVPSQEFPEYNKHYLEIIKRLLSN